MRHPLLICALLVLAPGTLAAGDFGDAPATFGLPHALYAGGPCLGTAWSTDASNPVTPAWSGDNDDGVVGNPVWAAGSATNSLTVQVDATGGDWMLTLWVDVNDDKAFSENERFDYLNYPLSMSGQFTFNNIALESINYLRSKRDFVAIRLILIQPGWTAGLAVPGPDSNFWYGEIEDWLIPVTPVGFSITNNAVLPDAEEGLAYNRILTAINGTAPYTWSNVGGALPTGLSLVPSGDAAIISGAPAVGTFTSWGNPLNVTIQCQDAAGNVNQRAFQLRVGKAACALPFADNFSTDKGWTYGPTWSRAVTTGAGPFAFPNVLGWQNYEPDTDATPASSDDMIIGDAIGWPYDVGIGVPRRATSPVIDCTAESSVQLVIWRWVGVFDAGYDHIGLEVSANGTSWTQVWGNPTDMSQSSGFYLTLDAGWTRMVYDISAVAANQPRVQVRFATGQTADGYGFSGWSVDDVEVRATPQSTLAVTQLDIQTTTTLSGQPLCYLGSYNWTAQVSNSSAEAVTLDSCIVGVFETPAAVLAQYSWHDVGVWTLTGPVTIAAGASVQVSGTFLCQRTTETGPIVEANARLILGGVGQTSGLRFEGDTSHILYLWDLPMPGLHVYETQAGGVEIDNGSAAVGQRDFGAQVTGTTAAWRNIVVKNTNSTTAITLGVPVLSGPNAGDFDLYTASYTTVLAAGQTTWFAVRFSPTVTGQSNASVSFSHDAQNTADPFSFDVTGLGVTNTAVAVVTETAPGGTPISNGAAASGGRDFGSMDINAGATGWLVICIENQGTQALTLGTLQLLGVAASEFTLDVTGLAASVAPGANTQFSVAFDPATTGAKSALVSFTHSGAGTASPFEFEVVGVGVLNVPVLVVSEMTAGGPSVAPGSTASSYRNFGAQDVGAGGTGWRYFYIENRGWQDLLLGAPALTGADAADFVLGLSGFSTTVPAQTTTVVAVAFDPAQQGPRSAWVAFTHNDPGAPSPFTFEVRGLATDPNGVVITTVSLPNARRTIPYDQLLIAAQGTTPYTWQLVSGSLPMGLTLASDGRLSGTSSATVGLYSFTVKVTDDLGGTTQAGLSILLSPAPGELGGGGNGGGGGCVAATQSVTWLILLPAMAALALRRRRKAA